MPSLPTYLGLLSTAGAAGIYFYMAGRFLRLRALGLETLDIKPQFDHAKASAIHDRLVAATGEGAKLYRHLLLVDFFFPPVFLLALLYWIELAGLPAWLAALAVVGTLADIVEDLLLVRMLQRNGVGQLPRRVAMAVAVATSIKLVCCLFALFGVLIGLVVVGTR